MIESVINNLNTSITSMSLGWKINGLCEMITEVFTVEEQEIEAKFPALYEGKDQLSYISNYDYRVGVVFHIPNGDQTEVDLDEVRVSQRRVERTWPMRMIAIIRRDIYNTDNAYSPLELISNLKGKISRRNITELRSELGVEKIKVNTGASSYDKEQILTETFVNIDFKATHNLMVVRIDYDIVISGDEQCFYEYGCPEIIVEDDPVCPTITLGDILADIEVGAIYDSTVVPNGGTAPYTFSGSVPAGLTLNTSTGQITGTITTEDVYNFSITATDADGCTGSRDYMITAVCPDITLGDIDTLVEEGESYSSTPSVMGGSPPYTFAVTIGALPTGLSLNENTGEISGTPTVPDLFEFTITVTDGNGCTGSRGYSIEVTAIPPPIPFDDLILWLKADEGPQLVGNEVTQWQDQSGNNYHADEIPGENRPELVPGVINGLPVVEWDNDKLLYTGPFLSTSDTMTIYVVLNAQTPGTYGWLFQTAGGQDNSGVSLVSVQGILALYGFFWAGSFAITNYTTSSNVGEFYILTIRVNNAGAPKQRLYKNGVLDSTDNNAAMAPSVQGYKMGHLYAGGYLFPFIGQLAEWIVYNVEHDDITAASIESYLQTKYGL